MVGRRTATPRWALSVAYVFVALAGLPIIGGAAWALWSPDARFLAEGVADSGGLGFLIASVGAVWLGFCVSKGWKTPE